MPESLRSSFDPTNPSTWLLRLLAQVRQVERVAVPALLANTFGGYLSSRASPASAASVESLVERLVDRMLGLDLLEEDSGKIGLSLLGRACGASSLSFESCMRLIEVLRAVGPQRDVLQRHAQDDWEYLARCKRAAILADWISGMPTEAIERAFTTNPFQGVIGFGDVVKFADATRFHLRSAHQIAALLFVDGTAPAEAVDLMLKRLQVGVPEDVLPLLDLPFTLTRGELLGLRAVGARTVDAFWSLAQSVLENVLGAERSKQIARQRPMVAAGA